MGSEMCIRDRDFPEAERACQQEAVWLDEAIFRAGKQGVEDTVAALEKIFAQRDLLKS